MEFATETKYRALMYDLSQFQKCNFHPNPMMAKFYTIGTQLPCTFSTKFGHQQNQIKITFLESLNIIYQRPVLRSCRKFGSLPKNRSSTPWALFAIFGNLFWSPDSKHWIGKIQEVKPYGKDEMKREKQVRENRIRVIGDAK